MNKVIHKIIMIKYKIIKKLLGTHFRTQRKGQV